jgi:hypothetical protein
MADVLVGGAFDPVGVVPGAFDNAWAGSVAARWVGVLTDLLDRVAVSVVEVLRG